MIWKVAYFIAPLAVMIAGNVVIYSFAIDPNADRWVRVAIAVALSLILFWGLLRLVEFLARKAALDIPQVGELKYGWLGVFLGITISVVCALAYAKMNDRKFDWDKFSSELPYTSLAAIAPASVEEATFRFGIVHGATVMVGAVMGCAVGSIPFGLGHLIDRIMGRTVSMAQVYGIVLAGLMLSLLYLEFGLWAAIGCHWSWNALASPWIKAMGLDISSGMSDFEGAVSTSLVLAVVTAFLVGRRLVLRQPQVAV